MLNFAVLANSLFLVTAVFAAVLSMCYAQGTYECELYSNIAVVAWAGYTELTIVCISYTGDMMPTDRTPNCQEMMRRFPFLRCDDVDPTRFNEEQCQPIDRDGGDTMICYCVDPMTGDRTSDRTYREDEFDNIDCDSKHGSYKYISIR